MNEWIIKWMNERFDWCRYLVGKDSDSEIQMFVSHKLCDGQTNWQTDMTFYGNARTNLKRARKRPPDGLCPIFEGVEAVDIVNRVNMWWKEFNHLQGDFSNSRDRYSGVLLFMRMSVIRIPQRVHFQYRPPRCKCNIGWVNSFLNCIISVINWHFMLAGVFHHLCDYHHLDIFLTCAKRLRPLTCTFKVILSSSRSSGK